MCIRDSIYTDDAQLNIDQMMEEMYATTTASKSACPSPDDYMKSFEGADNIVVVTITGTLSGSYNSAAVSYTHLPEIPILQAFLSQRKVSV